RNRPINVGGLNYAYDPAGNRTAITNGSTVTRFVVNPNAKLPQVLMRITGGTTNYYVYGAGLLYQVTETVTTSTLLTYHFDLRGSTIALANSGGYVTDQIQYSPYGLIISRTGTNDTPFLYNGRYGVMTDANGLLYMRARYYNPYICRFINPDPSGFVGGLNWYCFADGNPVSSLDPFGLWSWTQTGGVLRGLGGGLEAFTGYTLAAGSAAFGAATSWTGVGALAGAAGVVGGGAVGLHGLDQLQTGFRQAFSGNQVDSLTSEGLQAAGMSQNAANFTDAGISVVGSLGAGFATAPLRVATLRATDALSTEGLGFSDILSYNEMGAKALNSADYAELGGDATSTLFKAPYINDWIDTTGNPLTSQWYQRSGLNLILTGNTPRANMLAGGLGALFQGSAYGTAGSSTGK
ncbi:MAG TPA: RHS repeat-associated core domain-containing protein, partial [Verrucomicrobiae bacterium]|nr:RHS repeat-associated core domain-containing protein [Verrucomicrobiae bacterium]